ncbi:anti-sigma factor [Paucihalobacter ruber]|uniref:Anti-sigma factor n=1 Tax=Paucihalobacter ruber TaxID=2567861 RepID=A0A506PPM1_9FLAO|nr:anti-sigma factor [Paucihalobacter ruber]TPV35661.1 anti-sigma factor [Paucihalobacter ruber]
MNKKPQEFLASNLLDKYIIGATSSKENTEVEYFIDNFEEVKEAYQVGQKNLEILAKAESKSAPDLLNDIFQTINKADTIIEKEQPKIIHITQNQTSTPWYFMAASVAAVIFAIAATALYFDNKSLKSENQVVVDEIFDLRSDIENTNSQLSDLMRQFQKLNNPDTQKYVLSGNERASNLKTVAYINPVERTSMLDIISLPKLPEDQCYQIWGELQDRMVSLGIMHPNDAKIKPLPYLDSLIALTITIEDKGGNVVTSPEREVAEIILNQ